MNALPPFDFDLGADIDALRDLTQAFVRKELAPRAEKIDREDTFPETLAKARGPRPSWADR